MTLIITGPRDLWPWSTVRAAFAALPPDTLIVHGACNTGVDWVAQRVANETRLPIHAYLADWKQHGRSAGPIRNRQMAQEHPGATCWAFVREGFDESARGSGTADMVRCARAAGLSVRVVVCGEEAG